MLHGSHIMIGVGIYLIAISLLGLPLTALGITLVAISSLVPDIDHPKSFISHWSAFTKMISMSVSSVSVHRGLTHTVYGCFFWILLLAALSQYLYSAINPYIVIAGFVGYFSHLSADSFNPQGVHWLGRKMKVHLKGPVNTGGILEKYSVPVFLIVSVVIYLRIL